MRRIIRGTVAASFLGLFASLSLAQGDLSKVQIKAEKVAGGIHVLTGQGGNIGVLSGADGVIMIDDQYAPLSERIREAVRQISDQDIRFLINTHWHGDHTGGNEAFGKSGSVIVAHDNVRKRMSTEQFIKLFNSKVPASPAAALPVVTFSDRASFHLNGENIRLIHVAHAHTDGDTLIHFENANVIHMGDTFFNGLYPFIDRGSGGSVQGMIAAAEFVLDMIDEKTRIIPGHGAVTDREGLQAYLAMLKHLRDGVAQGIEQGQSLEQILAARPGARYDEKLGGAFINPEQIIGFVYDSLQHPPSHVGPAKRPEN